MYKEVTKCPISGKSDGVTYLNLGMMPLVNNLNATREESLNCPTFPLKVVYFQESKLSMLSCIVDPNVLFGHYVYKSGTSQPYIEHCREMYNYISKFVTVNQWDNVVDIGGNDGTLLLSFWKESDGKLWTINVDPSKNITELSRLKKIETHTEMWGLEVSKKVLNDRKAKIITSTNVFQHLEDIRGFVKGIHFALDDYGVWCLEFPYWKIDLDTNQFDQIYHEHIYYYMLSPLVELLKQEGMSVVDVSHHAIHGGTLRLMIKKGNNVTPKQNVLDCLKEEYKYENLHDYIKWGFGIENKIVMCRKTLDDILKEKAKIAAFGAAAKGCIFLNAIEFNHNDISYIVDDTDLKQGKFMPGTGIEIVSRERLIQDPPDYILILAHNFADYIMESLRPIYKGKFIVMFPEIKIYE